MRTPKLVISIIVLNILVFVLWQLSRSSEENFIFMFENFLVSWTALQEGRPWTLVTSVFSHNHLVHLMVNMFVLRSFGGIILETLGTMRFLNFYFLAGISGSFLHALVSLLILGEPALPALGASGAIAGIILLFSLTYPQERLLFLGFIPIRAKWGSLFIILVDLYGLYEQSQGGGLPIGHGAHLGGALMGLVWFFWMRTKRIAREMDVP